MLVKPTRIFMATNGLFLFLQVDDFPGHFSKVFFCFSIFIFLFGLLRLYTGILSCLKHQSICKTESKLPQRYWPYHKRYIMSSPLYRVSYNQYRVSPELVRTKSINIFRAITTFTFMAFFFLMTVCV